MEQNNENSKDQLSEMLGIMETIETIETIEQTKQASMAMKMRSFKSICGKIGLSMSVFYLCRMICDVVQSVVILSLSDRGETALYSINALISVIFVYILPLTFTMIIFDTRNFYKNKFGSLYKPPAKLARAMGNFPAVYGLGQSANIITLLIIFLTSLFSLGGKDIADTYKGMSADIPPNITCAAIFAFIAVILAPLFEEFWVRGILLDALKPYGNGFAIVITAVIFGAMHSNIRSLLFTTTLGLAFGYITYATGSIFISTVMHAIINSISAIFMMFLSTQEISDFTTTGVVPENELIFMIYMLYVFVVYAAVIVGIVSFFKKIKVIRKYELVKTWAEIKFSKKLFVYLTSAATVVWVLLAVNAHIGNPAVKELVRFLYKL